jgi:hypothetical protein
MAFAPALRSTVRLALVQSVQQGFRTNLWQVCGSLTGLVDNPSIHLWFVVSPIAHCNQGPIQDEHSAGTRPAC